MAELMSFPSKLAYIRDHGGETKREMDGLRPKGYAGTADHPREGPGQNILEIKNSGR